MVLRWKLRIGLKGTGREGREWESYETLMQLLRGVEHGVEAVP
jgi:hypothetical protein